jgi:hypothetical protein
MLGKDSAPWSTTERHTNPSRNIDQDLADDRRLRDEADDGK